MALVAPSLQAFYKIKNNKQNGKIVTSFNQNKITQQQFL